MQESADETSYRFPLCVYDKIMARDVVAEVKWKAISGSVDQAGGIVLRYTPENYYIARANALEDNIDLFKTVQGKGDKILEAPVKVTPGEWHTLRFEAKGPHLTVAFDGKTVVEADDTTFAEAGKVGLWTKADSVSAFADFKIRRCREQCESKRRQSGFLPGWVVKTGADCLQPAFWASHSCRQGAAIMLESRRQAPRMSIWMRKSSAHRNKTTVGCARNDARRR